MNTTTIGTHGAGWPGVERRGAATGTDDSSARIKRAGRLLSAMGWRSYSSGSACSSSRPTRRRTSSRWDEQPDLVLGLSIDGRARLSNLIGVIEISIGVLIATRAVWPRLSALGSLGAVITFLITLTFMLTTRGVWEPGYGFGFLSALPGQFLAKDLVLLGVSIWTAGEALHAAQAAPSQV